MLCHENKRADPAPHLSSTVELTRMGKRGSDELVMRVWARKSWPSNLSALGQCEGRDTLIPFHSLSIMADRKADPGSPKWEKWTYPCSSLAATLVRGSRVPHQGNRIELAMASGRECWWEQESLGLSSSDISQTQIQGCELAHSNIYPLMNCWNVRRGQSYISNMKGSLWPRATGHLGKAQVRVQYWQSSRSQRGLEPDQQLTAMNTCKQRHMDKRVDCGAHCDTPQSPQLDFFLLGGGCKGGGQGERKVSGIGVHDTKLTKNQ